MLSRWSGHPASRTCYRNFSSLSLRRFPSLPKPRGQPRPLPSKYEEEELSTKIQASLARSQASQSLRSARQHTSSGFYKNARVRSAGQFLFWLIIVGPVGLVLALHVPFELMWVNGESMSPLFNPNHSPDFPTEPDWIIVQRFFSSNDYLWWRPKPVQFARGQIITFYTPHSPNKVAVKRIVGLPGDRVMPLPGFPGGDVPQIVPYGHLWVEGDADTREKSMDSNWYGPISESLAIGIAVAIRTAAPWYEPWHWYKWVKFAKLPYAAKARVEESAVQNAMHNPDKDFVEEAFENGYAKASLNKILNAPEQLVQAVKTRPETLITFYRLYQRAQREVEGGTDQTNVDCAKQIVRGAEKVFEAAGIGHYEVTGPEEKQGDHSLIPE